MHNRTVTWRRSLDCVAAMMRVHDEERERDDWISEDTGKKRLAMYMCVYRYRYRFVYV